MQRTGNNSPRRHYFQTTSARTAICISCLLMLIAGIAVLSHIRSVEAAIASPTAQRIASPNYDIREDKSVRAAEILARYRDQARLSSAEAAGLRRGFARGEEMLRSRVASVKFEYDARLHRPEVITPDVGSSTMDLLTAPSSAPRPDVLRRFIVDNSQLFGIGPEEAANLVVAADYSNPEGALSFVRLEQHVAGVPVFQGEITAGLTRRNEIVRVINNLAPGLGRRQPPSDFGDPLDAVRSAANAIGYRLQPADVARNDIASTELKSVFGIGDWATTAEKFYFPTEAGVVRAAWRVLLWTPGGAVYVVVDASGDGLLWQKSLTEEQTLPATYNVYGSQTSLVKTADSPSPFTPGCLAPTGCPQPPAVARMDFTRVGNEAPYGFNDLGWIPDAGLPVRTPADPNITDGNNVEAGIDRMPPTGVDENGWARGNPTRVFSYTYNPAPGMPPPGEPPLPPTQTYPPSQFQQGAITHAFYTVNRWHDEMYRLGFTEQAGNFQHFNFGRGGSEGDRVSYEIQDGSGTNGANFSTTADGGRGRMQMFLWTGPDPDRDGSLDTQVVLHEITHGLSNRLHGNATGLGTNMARGMGEGWSDFYAVALLSEPADDPLGTHAVGGYVSYSLIPGWESNYYYGIRRFPIAVFRSRGPNGRPHNPLTFRHLNSNCNVEIGTSTVIGTISAYPRGPIGITQCDQIHNSGEIWAVTLWEVRDRLVQRHGAAEGTRRVLQYVTDGMKLAPLNPTFLQERDAILLAAAVGDPGDVVPAWIGFAIRGLGTNASIQTANPAAVTESFTFPNAPRTQFDFEGDGRADLSIFRPDAGNVISEWWHQRSSDGQVAAVIFGVVTDTAVPADLTGDGRTDIAIFRPNTGSWYVLRSEDNSFYSFPFGSNGDVPMPADYDGDGKADAAVYRPSNSLWVILRSSNGQAVFTTFGTTGDQPVAADYDGDGRADVGVWRPAGTSGSGEWWIQRSTDGLLAVVFGNADDKAVPADYTGDGKADIAVFRPASGSWFILRSEDFSFYAFPWGANGDVPVAADYDGDGRADAAVFRGGTWYINGSTGGPSIVGFGLATDRPVPGAFVR